MRTLMTGSLSSSLLGATLILQICIQLLMKERYYHQRTENKKTEPETPYAIVSYPCLTFLLSSLGAKMWVLRCGLMVVKFFNERGGVVLECNLSWSLS